MTTGIAKKYIKKTRNKTKKHNKIVMLARNKLNSIEAVISQVLINHEIGYKDFMKTINPNYDGYQRGLASMVYTFFDKKLLPEQLKMRICLIKN